MFLSSLHAYSSGLEDDRSCFPKFIRITRDARDARYSLLRGYFHGADDDTVQELQQERLLSVTLPAAAACVLAPGC